MTKEHIWNQWLQKLIPAAGDRIESLFTGSPMDSVEDISKFKHRPRQGAVHTLSSRTICQICNGGWMKKIGEAAKPIATKLIKGEAVQLGVAEQMAMATWIALSAVMANIKAQTKRKFPREDLLSMLRNESPPPRWFVGIGHYAGPSNSFACDQMCSRVGNLGAFQNEPVQLHSVATIMGHLFTYVVVPPTALVNPLSTHSKLALLVSPYIPPIWPPLFPSAIAFPRPWFERIDGALVPDGGLARNLSISYLQNSGWVHA